MMPSNESWPFASPKTKASSATPADAMVYWALLDLQYQVADFKAQGFDASAAASERPPDKQDQDENEPAPA